MGYDKFLIAPFQVGLEKDLESWLLPEDAFSQIENALIFRGRVKKRFGYTLIGNSTESNPQLNSRLRISLGNTNGAGDIAVVVPGVVFKVGQMFSVGINIYTVNALGAPAPLLVSGIGTGTYNTGTGAVAITGSDPATALFFYPSEPVMGLRQRENSAINQEETIGFDTQFAYLRSGGGWDRLDTTATGVWTGTNSDFFWTCNYRGAQASQSNMYVTNFNFNIGANTADNIRYLPSTTSTFTLLRPQLDDPATRYLESSLIIVPFKDRLVVFNTVESSAGIFSHYVNRCRFSQNGDPTNLTNSWLDTIQGRGGFIDCPTKQAIVSAQFLKDKLIVYFESSTYELVYTNNQILPFIWQKLNTELGAESTYSEIPFDKTIATIGNRGIHICTGVDVQRMDEKIPDEVFKIHNGNDGPKRVYGIRDYYTEAIYWTFPSFVSNPTFPNQVLVYNYKNNTWSFYLDTFTCFGYYQPTDDTQWQTLAYETWEVWNDPWSSSQLQSEFQTILAGNQQGFTVQLDRDKSDNDAFYQITDFVTSTLTVIDHNFRIGEYFQIQNANGITGVNGIIILVVGIIDSDNFLIDLVTTGTYEGGGTLKRVSNIDILTKRYNPYTDKGLGFNLPQIDFFVDKTEGGQVSIDFYANESSYSTRGSTNSIPGTGVLSTSPEPLIAFEAVQDKLWHRMFFYMQAYNIQLRIYMNDAQMRDPEIAYSNFELNGMVLYVLPGGPVVA